MRPATAAVVDIVAEGAIVAVAVLAAAALAGLAWRRFSGRMHARQRDGGAGQPWLTAADLGQPLGTNATLLQFSSPVCAPCRAARLLLADIAAGTPGVTHIELDVSSRMDLVRQFGIRRTPTVFVLGRHGEVAQRASGVPAREDVLSAMAIAAGDQQIGSDRGVPHT
jgi:thiol-disulfide isomerase/thioredoxin